MNFVDFGIAKVILTIVFLLAFGASDSPFSAPKQNSEYKLTE